MSVNLEATSRAQDPSLGGRMGEDSQAQWAGLPSSPDPPRPERLHASADLLPGMYHDLRQLAAWNMARDFSSKSWQAMDLLHEACLRLLQEENCRWMSRNHLFCAAAKTMRRILIERARRRNRRKHGGGWQQVPLQECDNVASTESATGAVVEEALERLQETAPFKAELVKLRFFAGLNSRELARVLKVSEPTIKREWAQARAWLHHKIKALLEIEPSGPPDTPNPTRR